MEQMQEEAKKQRSKYGLRWLALVVIGIVLVGIAIFWVFNRHSGGGSDDGDVNDYECLVREYAQAWGVVHGFGHDHVEDPLTRAFLTIEEAVDRYKHLSSADKRYVREYFGNRVGELKKRAAEKKRRDEMSRYPDFTPYFKK